eukprot:796382-Pyramimonas_sp.AAC.1
MCVYIQAVWAEYYQAKGLSSATLLLDLKKAFELVKNHHVLAAAKATIFPRWQLKLLVLVYSSPRLLDLQGIVSNFVAAETTIIPGCGFATVLLQLILLRPHRYRST